MKNSYPRPFFVGRLAGTALTVLVASLATAGPFRRTDDFKGVKTASDAVKLAQKHLTDAGKPEYAGLLTEERVRAAIKNAVKSYELTAMEVSEKRFPGTKEHFQNEIKPICLKIADKGDWPSGCSIDAYFSLQDERNGEKISYDGMGLSLQIDTPNSKFKGFALPILMLFFGRFEPPCE